MRKTKIIHNFMCFMFATLGLSCSHYSKIIFSYGYYLQFIDDNNNWYGYTLDSIQNIVITEYTIQRKEFRSVGNKSQLLSEKIIYLDSCCLDDSVRNMIQNNDAKVELVKFRFFDGNEYFFDSLYVIIIKGNFQNEYGCIIQKEYRWHPVLGFYSMVEDSNTLAKCEELEDVETKDLIAFQINCSKANMSALKSFGERICKLHSALHNTQ